jgi:GNAT superfamily N-acetyltransferase
VRGAPPAPATDDITPAGHAGETGELYALYVAPAWWSAGAGRALMASVLAALGEARYLRAVLWVLADNARARRFYERAGFAPDGATHVLAGLGGVLEVRYARDI